MCALEVIRYMTFTCDSESQNQWQRATFVLPIGHTPFN